MQNVHNIVGMATTDDERKDDSDQVKLKIVYEAFMTSKTTNFPYL